MSKIKLGIVGMGATGFAVLNYVLNTQYADEIRMYDDQKIDSSRIPKTPATLISLIGNHSFKELENCQQIIISPGVNGKAERFNRLRDLGIEIISEIEFSFRFIQAKIIAITGSNGKSTTVSLIHHLLSRSGFKSFLLGNIGTPLISQVNVITKDSVVVLELSSFQLEEISRFKADIAILLNITPDHLDRYPSMSEYAQAKLNICNNQTHQDVRIFNANDEYLQSAAAISTPSQTLWFGTKADFKPLSAFIDVANQQLVLNLNQTKETYPLELYHLKGIHNQENLMAALLACRLLAADPKMIKNALPEFKSLPHRMEPAGSVGRVEYINDSKATNLDAAYKSLCSFEKNVVLILGGKDKGGDFSVLQSEIEKRVKKVLLIGQAAPLIEKQLFKIQSKLLRIADLTEAIAIGYDILKDSGGVVLLAPACASFDMFNNFEHRGQCFLEEVKNFKAKTEHGIHG
jgi:UDP-N-acetylmuramoylalanine--D-glutamate ligase